MFKKILTFFFDVSSSNWHHKLFLYGLYISYLLFFIAFTGIITLSPTYLSNLESWIKYYVCFILLFIKKRKIILIVNLTDILLFLPGYSFYFLLL